MIQARRQIRYSAIALVLSIAALIVSIISAVSVQRTKPEILTALAEEAAELRKTPAASEQAVAHGLLFQLQ